MDITIGLVHGLDADTREFLRELVRPLIRGLNRLEQHMSEIDDVLASTDDKVTTLVASFADLASDVRALIAELRAAAAGNLSVEQRAKADDIDAALAAIASAQGSLDTEVGDADGSDTPPAAPADVPPADAEPVV